MEWPERFLRVIEGASAVIVASRDAQMRPRAARGALVRRGSGPDDLLVYVVPGLAAHVLPNLRDNGAIALMVALTATHEAYQVKGQVTEIGDAPAADEPVVRDHMAKFAEDGARLGVSRRLIERVICWPALMLQVKATHIFHQSPGPGAGERVRT
jgi:hypothetical protein